MPTAHKNETRQKFISRAIRMMVNQEGLSQKHAVGKAHGLWEQHIKQIAKRKIRRG